MTKDFSRRVERFQGITYQRFFSRPVKIDIHKILHCNNSILNNYLDKNNRAQHMRFYLYKIEKMDVCPDFFTLQIWTTDLLSLTFQCLMVLPSPKQSLPSHGSTRYSFMTSTTGIRWHLVPAFLQRRDMITSKLPKRSVGL